MKTEKLRALVATGALAVVLLACARAGAQQPEEPQSFDTYPPWAGWQAPMSGWGGPMHGAAGGYPGAGWGMGWGMGAAPEAGAFFGPPCGYGPQGPWSMHPGHGMMGAGPGSANLDADQRRELRQIHQDSWKRRRELMGALQTEQEKLRELLFSGAGDAASLSAAWLTINDLQRQVMEANFQARKRMLEVWAKSAKK